MSIEPIPTPDLDEAPGWVVRDPDGNVVDSGPLTRAEAAFLMGEADDNESERS